MKALVAMSGGVDSSVAAFLLQEKGIEVIGLSFELWDDRDRKDPNLCCSVETINIAREVTERLGLEHLTIDVRDSFYRQIIEKFCSSYISGMTPNPCILCNKFIKFKFLLEKANEIGADLIATGHYARIQRTQNLPTRLDSSLAFGSPRRTAKRAGQAGTEPRTQSTDSNRFLLKKGVDPKKDQSYFLYVMTQMELSKTVFPLGEIKKEETRRIAKKLGLANALRPESQEICFVGNGKYVDFIKGFAPEMFRPGQIINTRGDTIGEHKGIALYTIGQRKRLDLQTLKPHYVADIDRKNNVIMVGSREDVLKKTFKVKELSWISINSLSDPIRVSIKFRSTMKEEPGIIIPEENQRVTVEFDHPQWAPAPGQSAVFYDGDLVVGGGIIESK